MTTEERIWLYRQLWADACKGITKKYRQHRDELASKQYKSFCCLGVALESVPALGAQRACNGAYHDTLTRSFINDGPNNPGKRIASELTEKQASLLGISASMMRFLVDLNDSRHVPLEVIGTVILSLPIATAYKDYHIKPHDWEGAVPAITEALTDYQKVYD